MKASKASQHWRANANRWLIAAGIVGIVELGGQTWSPVAHNLPGTDIHGFAVDPDDANKVYAHVVGFAGLFVSEDGGQTWEALELKGLLMAVATSPTDPNRLISVDENGWVYASHDGGETWLGG